MMGNRNGGKSPDWTPAETALLRQYVQDGLDSAAIAERFKAEGIHRTQRSVSLCIWKHRRAGEAGWGAQVKAGASQRFTQAPVNEAARWLLCFDIHAPYHDARFCNEMIELALRWDVKHAIIGGDLIDWAALSPYGKEASVLAEDEIRAAEQVTTAFARNFEQVVYIGGNHEARITRLLDAGLPLTAIARMFVGAPNVQVTDYHWCEIVSCGERYQIEHPKNASIHATLVPKKLCAKFGKHVIAGHGHVWGMARDDSGRYWAIDSGIMADPDKIAYANLEHNTRPVMQQGACLVIDGAPILVAPQNIEMYKRIKW